MVRIDTVFIRAHRFYTVLRTQGSLPEPFIDASNESVVFLKGYFSFSAGILSQGVPAPLKPRIYPLPLRASVEELVSADFASPQP